MLFTSALCVLFRSILATALPPAAAPAPEKPSSNIHQLIAEDVLEEDDVLEQDDFDEDDAE